MAKVYDLAVLRRLCQQALQNGGRQHSAVRWSWDVSGNCQEPVVRELHARPSPDHRTPLRKGGTFYSLDATLDGAQAQGHEVGPDRPRQRRYITVAPGTSAPLTLELTVRCRRCDPCRAIRRRMWTARAKRETGEAVRTWFGTLTLRPEVHFVHLSRARQRLALQGVDYDTLSYHEQFVQLHNQSSRELTLMLKRVRKATGSPFKFMLVAEAHRSGLPHYHMLIHEQDAAKPIRKAVLDKNWPCGFVKWRLVRELGEATYLCKYLSKSTAARVRASVRYGDGREEVTRDALEHSHRSEGVPRPQGEGITSKACTPRHSPRCSLRVSPEPEGPGEQKTKKGDAAAAFLVASGREAIFQKCGGENGTTLSEKQSEGRNAGRLSIPGAEADADT